MVSTLLLASIFVTLITTIACHPSPSPPCFPSILSFGDSKADTGNIQAAFAFESAAEYAPYGRTFFGRPSDRYCDGRLVIDFQAQAYGLPFLSPYLRGLGSDFRHGANFAASGGGAIPNLTTIPFYLERQFQQFRKFKARYFDLQHSGYPLTPANQYFGEGLYVVSIGENDYRTGLLNGLNVTQIKAEIVPQVIEIINTTVKGLYGEGARKFLVVGIAADGCIPLLLTLLPSGSEDLDDLGCLKSVNNYVQYHNAKLREAVKKLRVEYEDAEIAFGDYFGINVEILSNASAYGFTETHKACCGFGGKSNYNAVVHCGQSGEVDGQNVIVNSCDNPSSFINWDGIHLTEHFYELVAKAFLQGHFVDPPLTLPLTCNLDFSQLHSP